MEFGYFNYVDVGREDNCRSGAAEASYQQYCQAIRSNIMDRERGLINLRVKDVGDFIQVELEDNGKGIAAKDSAKYI